ncbi:hypothetical protein DNTS_011844 [Danionella cerebrum]|uniref:Uncharacterized protein n=1 Tax=Danionella cerebrum TaxID=2873325 RepID=A0A553MWG3_9TELE|nr:hypothetical protein DNTS_011844 [Danionella translucida]
MVVGGVFRIGSGVATIGKADTAVPEVDGVHATKAAIFIGGQLVFGTVKMVPAMRIRSRLENMRRSAAKSRSDKSRADVTVSGAQPLGSIQPPEMVDIVTGRMTESAWISMITQEEDEEAVADIISELMERVMDKCQELYLKSQVIPFSVWWAQNNLVETLGYLFVTRDEGDDPERDSFWQEDTEPQPCVIDSWAEGSVPVLYSPQ